LFVYPAAFAALGDKDKAFMWLDKSHNEHDPNLAFLNGYALFDNLRSDPRFQVLVHRIGIPTQEGVTGTR